MGWNYNEDLMGAFKGRDISHKIEHDKRSTSDSLYSLNAHNCAGPAIKDRRHAYGVYHYFGARRVIDCTFCQRSSPKGCQGMTIKGPLNH
jgi:hypothetical protein